MRDQRGTFLISSYLVLSILGVFSLAVYSHQFAAVHSHERFQNLSKAFHLAEAGTDRALSEIKNNPATFVVCDPLIFPTCWQQGYSPLGEGGYETKVTWVSPLVRKVEATGYIPNNNPASPRFVKRIVETHVTVGVQASGIYGIFGCSGVDLSGNAKVDSFNSAVAPYNPVAPGFNGDLGTNTIASGGVTLSGNTDMKGDIFVGPGGNPLTVVNISGNATQIGLQAPALSPTPCNDVQVPGGVNNGGNFHLSGNTTQILPGGTYLYDSFKMSGNARLIFNGPATIYVQGNVNLEGSTLVSSAGDLPKNVVIKVAGQRNVDLEGGTNLYGVIYSPRSQVQTEGNARIYGALFGETYRQQGNAEIHYDEDLSNLPLSEVVDFVINAWQEK